MDYLEMKCVPCEGGVPPYTREQALEALQQAPGWTLKDKSIEREFKFKDFREAMKFINHVAELAEGEGHHPDIYVFYNRVRLELYTHAIDGLFDNDFVTAAKINRLLA